MKPVAGTESCQTHHVGTVASGQLRVRHNEGTEVGVGRGDAYVIEPGHNAWELGSEPFVAYAPTRGSRTRLERLGYQNVGEHGPGKEERAEAGLRLEAGARASA